MTDLIPSVSSEVLALRVVAYRVIKFQRDEAKAAMAELAARRANGDDFQYEAFIEEKVKECTPNPADLEGMDLETLLGGLNGIPGG